MESLSRDSSNKIDHMESALNRVRITDIKGNFSTGSGQAILN